MYTVEFTEQELNFITNASFTAQISARDAKIVVTLQEKLLAHVNKMNEAKEKTVGSN